MSIIQFPYKRKRKVGTHLATLPELMSYVNTNLSNLITKTKKEESLGMFVCT